MYEAHFGFREKPFQLTPDPDYLYLSAGHADVLMHLEYAIQENQGFVVVTGEIGSGKTTLINHLLRKVEQRVHVGVLSNTSIPASQFLRAVCEEYDLPAAGLDRVETLTVLNRFLLDQFAAGDRVTLIVDEAQNLSEETLEELRLLSNLQTEKHFLIQMILVGQPELRLVLRRQSLEQLRQRITVQCHLGALVQDEVAAYIRRRVTAAGGSDPDLFDAGAVRAVYRYSGGIPRLINVACDSALVAAYSDGRHSIDAALMESIIEARNAGSTFEAPPGPPELRPPTPVEERLNLVESCLLSLDAAVSKQDERLTAALKKVGDRLRELKAAIESVDRRAQVALHPETGAAKPSGSGTFRLTLRKLLGLKA